MIRIHVDASWDSMSIQLAYPFVIMPGFIYSLTCACQLDSAKYDISITIADIYNQMNILDFGAIKRVALVVPFFLRSIVLLRGVSPKFRASFMVWRISERSVSDLPIPISSANMPPRHLDVMLACLIFVTLCLNLGDVLASSAIEVID